MPRSSVSVEFSDREFRLSHGRDPRGYGSWGFEILNGSRSMRPEVAWFPASRFAEARRACIARVREACAIFGISSVVVYVNVCP
jgi:hypothetical protein